MFCLFYFMANSKLQHPHIVEESPLHLGESSVEVASDYTKRKNVFRVRGTSSNQSNSEEALNQHQHPPSCEFLFQAEGEDSMLEWVQAIGDAAERLAAVVVVTDGAQQQQQHLGNETVSSAFSISN